MFIDRKTQCCHTISYSQFWIQCNTNQNPNKLLCEYQQTDSKVSIERQKNSQYDIEREQKTDTT